MTSIIRLTTAIVFLVGGCCSSVLWAEERPLWEIGIGAGALTIPDYRGAQDNQSLVFPFIFPVYRGDIFKVDNDGARGILYESNRTELDFSVDGSVPANSDDIEVREGMPDIDPSFQIGPSLRVNIWEIPEARQSFILNIPLRGVFAIDSGIEHIGYTLSPHVTYYRDMSVFNRNWRLGLSAGLEFGSDDFHDYFYTVAPEFATPTRSQFNADAGYAGTRFIATFQGRKKNNWLSLFARYDRVDGATFEDSPLVRKDGGLTAGVIASWFIAKSKRLVKVDKSFN